MAYEFFLVWISVGWRVLEWESKTPEKEKEYRKRESSEENMKEEKVKFIFFLKYKIIVKYNISIGAEKL